MESFSGDTEESTEEIPGRKKYKLKSLRTRLFGRSKRTGGEGDANLSQSASDIAAGKGLGSDEDLACSQGMMGSRALSHDSIFLADQVLTEAEPARVLSQENVHSKIKALQMKLQQQKMHLGPPPLVLPIRRPEDLRSRPEDDGHPHSPTEISEALSKTTSQPSSRPLSPTPKPAPTKSVPPTPSIPSPLSVSSNSSTPVVEPPLDFSSPAQFTSCLDTSAARHRMSVKPKKQRASTKRTLAVNDSHLQTLNSIDHPESVIKEERRLSTQEEETEQGEPVTLITCQPPEITAVTSEAASKPSSQTLSQQDQTPLEIVSSAPSQVLRVKPPRPAVSTERPHSSFIQSELRDNRDRETQLTSNDKRNTLNKADISDQFSSPFGSVHQQVQGETESTAGIKRPTPGFGSFHFSITTAKNRDGERPRSGSFVGVLGQIEARNKAAGGTEDKPFSVGRLKQEGAPQKSSVPPWDRKDSLKKTELATPSKNVTTDAGAAEAEMESSQELVEEAMEAKEVEEDEGKTAFGVKLRSTLRFRSDASSNQKPPEEQCDKQKRQEIRDTTPSGISLPVKHNLPSVSDTHTMTTEVQTNSNKGDDATLRQPQQPPQPQQPQEPQPAPQTATSEVSWMSLAMEKTRSLQQLFTSKFPRDFTGAQTAARPQAQVQTETGAQTQTAKIQQSATPPEAVNQTSTDAVKAETVQSRSQAQTVKPSLMAVQQKTSREPQTLKQTSENQPAPHPAIQGTTRTAQSPSHSSTQTHTSSQPPQGSATQSLAQSYLSSGQQQPPWSSRGLHTASQLKLTTSAPTSASATAPPPASASGQGEREVQEKESGRRAPWAGSVSEKTAFLEKRAEWSAPSGTKGVELRKAQTEVQTSGESVKPTPLSKDIKPEGRQWVKPAESSPTKVPERPREEKWLRKNVAPSSSPSSSPTMPSALQSMPDSGQPSWMELAKRKSMAWSDKSMD